MYASAYLRLSFSLSPTPILRHVRSPSGFLRLFPVGSTLSLFLSFSFFLSLLFPLRRSEKEKENEMRTGTSSRNREERACSRSEEDEEERSTRRIGWRENSGKSGCSLPQSELTLQLMISSPSCFFNYIRSEKNYKWLRFLKNNYFPRSSDQ